MPHIHRWVIFPLCPSVFLSVKWLDDFFGLLFYSRLCDFTISLAFKNSVRQGVLQNHLLYIGLWESLVLFFVISKKFVFKRRWSILSLDLWGSCLFNLSRFLFSLQMISTGLLLSCALWISTFEEKWKHCTFKGTKSKTVASRFKVTELVNFLVCFADLNEKDLIECYY